MNWDPQTCKKAGVASFHHHLAHLYQAQHKDTGEKRLYYGGWYDKFVPVSLSCVLICVKKDSSEEAK